ncbi:MAG TPA: DUF2442 domain-containing protein [Beijerinckiaceae bacterium]|nr:DUF2442 domain-containing protein [Beijerinckiaceae bacterium]
MTILEIDDADIRAVAVEFSDSELIVRLADGRRIATPLDWYPRLAAAALADRQKIEISPLGLHWPALDEDLSIAAMLAGRKARAA